MCIQRCIFPRELEKRFLKKVQHLVFGFEGMTLQDSFVRRSTKYLEKNAKHFSKAHY